MSNSQSNVINTHGGARRGAGRKPGSYVKSQEVKDFEGARARNEAAKADLNELDFKIKSRQYISRIAVQQAAATALAAAAQTLRSMPDAMERKGLGAEWCQIVEAVVDQTLNELATQYEAMTAPPLGGDE